MRPKVAAFIDRDGVINDVVPDPVDGVAESPLRVNQVRLMPGAAAALRRLANAGWLLVGVSNQPGAAKGKASIEQLDAVQTRVIELLADEGVRFDAFRVCLHHPQGLVTELSHACDSRKPAPGMLLGAARELGIELSSSWMIGDTDADVLAGVSAGCHTVLVENPSTAHKRSGIRADAVAPSLEAAVGLLVPTDR